MRVAVTGAAGLFGYGLVKTFASYEVVPLTRATLDITDAVQVRRVFQEVRPDIVIHSAGIADLDICEIQPEKAQAVNVDGTQFVVEAARGVGAAVAYISTDAVFDGKKGHPYTESDLADPPSVYGRTKLAGERIVRKLPEHWIFRVSVLFGPGKTNFVEKVLRQVSSGQRAIVAADQVGSATYTLDAARTILQVIKLRSYGTFHLSNQGSCSRFQLALQAAKMAGMDPSKVLGVQLNKMGRPGPRLKYSIMDMSGLKRAGIVLPRPWEVALKDYLSNLELVKQKDSPIAYVS